VAPYSLRGLAWPTVATPVTWEEVEEAAATADSERLTFVNSDIPARIDRYGDLFQALI
jgi:bifunctional non-homologous end joining protein LigD